MSMSTAVKTCLRKYICFRGRAPRSEYWCFILAYMLAMCVAFGILLPLSAFSARLVWASVGLISLISLAGIPPLLTVTVRRLHDSDLRGWWMSAYILPYPLGMALGLLMGLPVDETRDVLVGADSLQVRALLLVHPLQYIALLLPQILANLLMLYFTIRRGTPGPNRFGPDPLASPDAPHTCSGAGA